MGDCRETDDESGALPSDIVMAKNLAAVLLDDAIADAEAKPGALSDLFGCEEGVENLVGMSNSIAIIGKRHLYRISGFGGHDLDASRAADFVHRVVSVVQNVEKDLLQLVGVADYVGQSLVEMLDYIDAMTIEVVRAQLDGAAQDRIQLQSIALWRHLASEAKQVLDDLLGALCFLKNDAKIFACAFGEIGILHEQVREAEDRREGVVNLMRDTGDQLTDCSHFFRMD